MNKRNPFKSLRTSSVGRGALLLRLLMYPAGPDPAILCTWPLDDVGPDAYD